MVFVAEGDPTSIEFFDATPGPNIGSRVLLDCVALFAGPVAIVTVIDDLRLCPIYYCDRNENAHFVIAANGTNATVILDASASYDPNGDSLQFAWERLDGGGGLFASGVRTTNALNGDTRFRLHVSNGTSEAVLDFAVYLETPVAAIYGLMDAILELEEQLRSRHALDVLLTKAADRFQRGDIGGTVKSLELFQNKIAAQRDSLGAANAADLVHIAQKIIDAVSTR